MTNHNKNFYETMHKYNNKLNMYSKALTKVHGGTHPEVFDVRHLFERIDTELKKSNQNGLNLDIEFESLREVTKITQSLRMPVKHLKVYTKCYLKQIKLIIIHKTIKGEMNDAKSSY